MNLSELVKSEIERKPPRIVLHGIHGVGKSTWAAKSPNPIFLITEDGLTDIEVNHFPFVTDYNDVLAYMRMLIDEEHEYQTFVLDTADWLEKLIWAKVCEDHNVKSIESLGYGKGYQFAMQHWAKIFDGMNRLRSNGMAIVVLAHNEIKIFSPPDGDSYDRFQIKLHRHAASMLEEWADCVLFANFQVFTDSKTKKVVNTAERIIHTTNRPAWRAKTRYALPETLPMDFNALLSAIKNGGKNNG